jgi:hypothetical protein
VIVQLERSAALCAHRKFPTRVFPEAPIGERLKAVVKPELNLFRKEIQNLGMSYVEFVKRAQLKAILGARDQLINCVYDVGHYWRPFCS